MRWLVGAVAGETLALGVIFSRTDSPVLHSTPRDAQYSKTPELPVPHPRVPYPFLHLPSKAPHPRKQQPAIRSFTPNPQWLSHPLPPTQSVCLPLPRKTLLTLPQTGPTSASKSEKSTATSNPTTASTPEPGPPPNSSPPPSSPSTASPQVSTTANNATKDSKPSADPTTPQSTSSVLNSTPVECNTAHPSSLCLPLLKTSSSPQSTWLSP